MPQSYRMNWQGRRLWTDRGRARAARGLQLALEHVLAESNKLVPLEEGTLQRSGQVAMDANALVGTVSYGTPYAVRQHEETGWTHAPGRQAKYLETAVNNSRQDCLRIMQAELRRWLG